MVGGLPIMGTGVSEFVCPAERNDQAKYNTNGTLNSYFTNYCVNVGTWMVYDPTGATFPTVRFIAIASFVRRASPMVSPRR